MEEDIVIKRIFGKKSFEEIKHEFDRLFTSSICRNVIGKKQIYYRCKTCQLTMESYLCVDCFQKGNHQHHDSFLQKKNIIGMCCCGNQTMMKQDSYCYNHQNENHPNSVEMIPDEYKHQLVSEIEMILQQLQTNTLAYQSSKKKIFKKSTQIYHEIEILQNINILKKLSMIDLLFYLIIDLIDKKEMNEMIVQLCFEENEQISKEMCMILLDIVNIPENGEKFYSSFLKSYLSLFTNQQMIKPIKNEYFIPILYRFISNKELTMKYIITNENVISQYFEIIINFMKIINKISIENELMDKMNEFIEYFCEIGKRYSKEIIHQSTFIDNLITLLEILTFYNEEMKITKQHKEYDDSTDLKMQYLSDEIITLCYRCIDQMNANEIINFIQRLKISYNQLQDKHIKPINEIEIGRNQSISKYYMLITILSYCMMKIKTNENLSELIVYPILYQLFLTEMNYDSSSWIRNGKSIEYKTNLQTSQYCAQLMNDCYLFQIVSIHDSHSFLTQLKQLCKYELLKDIHQMNNQKRKEITIGMICMMKIIYNIYVDPIYSCQLTPKEIITYIIIHVIIEEKYTINEIYSLIPTVMMRLVDYSIDDIIHEIIEIKSNKIYLQEKYKKYINPYSLYHSLNTTTLIEEKIGRETQMMIYKKERRTKEIEESLKKFLHNEEISEMILTVLQNGKKLNEEEKEIDTDLMNIIGQVLKLRIMNPIDTQYSEHHQELMKEIGKEICNNDVNEIIYEILERIEEDKNMKEMQEEMKQKKREKQKYTNEEKKKKQQMIKKKMEMKQKETLRNENIPSNIIKNKKGNEEEQNCIICQNDENTSKESIGYLCHIEMTHAIQMNEEYERNEKIQGKYENGKWIKPEVMETMKMNEIKKREEYRILSFCPHKIHYHCYKQQYEYQINEENYYLKNTIYCPLCGTLSTLFIQEQNHEYVSYENCSSSLQMILKHKPQQIHGKEEYQHEELTESELKTLESTLTRTIRNENITQSLYEMAFLSGINVIISTVMSMEIESRRETILSYEEKISVLNSYLTIINKGKSYVSKEKRREIIKQMMEYNIEISEKERLNQFIQTILFNPSEINTYLYYLHLHHFMKLYPLMNQMKDDEILDEINERSISFFKQIEIIKQILSNTSQIIKENEFQMKYTTEDIKDMKEIIEYEILTNKKNTIIIQQMIEMKIHPNDIYQLLPTKPKKYQMIQLPQTYQELLENLNTMKCTKCKRDLQEIIHNNVICMNCGSILCYYDKKKENRMIHSPTPVFDHQKECCGEVGIYFITDSSSLLIISPNYHSVVRNIYVNSFGETPKQTILTKGMYTLQSEMISKIERFYLTGKITSSPELVYYVPHYH